MGSPQGRTIKDSTIYNADENGNIIPGGSKISEIIKTAATATNTWTAVTTTKPCKQIAIGMADGTQYLLSDVAAGTTSLFVPANTILTFSGGFRAGTLFYVQGSAGTPTFSCVCFD